MVKKEREIPAIVRFSQVIGDNGALSRLGKAGAMRKKELAGKDRERRIRRMLDSCAEMTREANEHICPID